MFALDLFNNDYERRLAEGAVDQLEQRRIDDLAMKMDDLVARAKQVKDPEHKAALVKEFQKVKAERDSYFKIKDEGVGYGGPGEENVNEGSMKDMLWDLSDRMDREQFIDYTTTEMGQDANEMAEFWDNIHGPVDEGVLDNIRAGQPGSSLDAIRNGKPLPTRPQSAPRQPSAPLQATPRATTQATTRQVPQFQRGSERVQQAIDNTPELPGTTVTRGNGYTARSFAPGSEGAKNAAVIDKMAELRSSLVKRNQPGDAERANNVQAEIRKAMAGQHSDLYDQLASLVESGIGHDIVNKAEKIARATPSTPGGKVASTVKNAAKWLAGKGGPGKEGPTYEAADPIRNKAGKMIDKYFGQIYNYGDSGLDYLDNNAPVWFDLFNNDQYGGDIDTIVAQAPINLLAKAAQELKDVASDLPYELDETGSVQAKTDDALRAHWEKVKREKQAGKPSNDQKKSSKTVDEATDPKDPSGQIAIHDQGMKIPVASQYAGDGQFKVTIKNKPYIVTVAGFEIDDHEPGNLDSFYLTDVATGKTEHVTGGWNYPEAVAIFNNLKTNQLPALKQIYKQDMELGRRTDWQERPERLQGLPLSGYNVIPGDRFIKAHDDMKKVTGQKELDEKKLGQNRPKLGSARDIGKSVKKFRAQRGLDESQQLHQGDPVVVTAPNEFEGKTGEIYEFSPSGKFVIVDLYNHGKHSMHLSDVEYNQYADKQDEDDWYDEEDTMEGWQDFNKVEPYAVCLAGKPVKKFDYYEQARRFHDNWKQKLYREGNKEKADKITLMPLNLDEGKWDYPKSMTTIPKYDKDADDYLALHQGAKFARKNKEDRKKWRQATKAQAHKELMTGKKDVAEAGSPAQQAAIAIAMKKAGKKPKSVDEDFNTSSLGDAECPKCHQHDLSWEERTQHVSCRNCGSKFKESGKEIKQVDELDASTLKSYADKRGAQVAAMKADNPDAPAGSPEWIKAAVPGIQVARAKQKIARKERQAGVTEDTGSWIVYDPETRQIKKRFKTHTAGKSYAKTHGLGFASSEYYFDRVKEKAVAEGVDNNLPSFEQYIFKKLPSKFTDLSQVEDLFDYSYLSDLGIFNIADEMEETGAPAKKVATQRVKWVLQNMANKKYLPMIKPLAIEWINLVSTSLSSQQGVAEGQQPMNRNAVIQKLETIYTELYQDEDPESYDLPAAVDYWHSLPADQLAMEFENAIDRLKQSRSSIDEAQTDYQKRRARERDVDAGRPVKPLPRNPQTDYARKRAKDKRDMELGEDQDNSGVERAILNRIMVAHTDLLKQFGPQKVMQAAEEVAYNVGDVDEIGSSDVSAYVNQVRQILGA